MPSNLKIKTDHKWRDIIYGHELTEKERKEFDYLDSQELDDRAFVQYRGHLYDLGEFMAIHDQSSSNPLHDWHGIHTDSFFSAILVRYNRNCDKVQIATCFS